MEKYGKNWKKNLQKNNYKKYSGVGCFVGIPLSS